ncbi:hypothetical protein E8E11_011071 [Didymella keratinophila]|nr:hypothetical protein E8E11_011071 [Didymella keratinophila]
MEVGLKKSPNYTVLFSTEFSCVYSVYALAFWQGVRRYQSGKISESGDVFKVILAVIVAETAMTQIAPQILAFTMASSSAEEIFRTIDRQSETDPLDDAGIIPETCTGNIQIEGVSFAYPARPDITVLKSLKLSAPANKTTALVGASGSEKSTIIGLLERWYDQTGGTTYLDGVDIRELNLHWLRTNVRLVQQEPVLFAGTVYDTVAYGLFGTPQADLPELEQRALIEKACKDAYADGLAMMSVDVDVRPGQFIALVGASGCGKSTMVSLLERFYDPVAGRIMCDGTAVPELCPREYRRDIALVQQEPVLYQGSIRDNIAMGVESEVTDAQVKFAAKQSDIHDFIMSLPEGFGTFCGNRGTQLSGGQR